MQIHPLISPSFNDMIQTCKEKGKGVEVFTSSIHIQLNNDTHIGSQPSPLRHKRHARDADRNRLLYGPILNCSQKPNQSQFTPLFHIGSDKKQSRKLLQSSPIQRKKNFLPGSFAVRFAAHACLGYCFPVKCSCPQLRARKIKKPKRCPVQ